LISRLNQETDAGFEAKPVETVTTSFEAKLEKTVATGFEVKPEKTVATGFEAKPEKTVTSGFEAKPPKIVATGFEAKPVKTVRVVLRRNHSQIADLVFKAQLINPCSSSSRARFRPHTASPNLSIARPPSTRSVRPSSVLCIRSPTLARSLSLHAMAHLPPAHHETSKHDFSNESKIKEKQNETIPDLNSNLAKSMTHHNQTKELATWFLRFQAKLSTEEDFLSCAQYEKETLPNFF
jgi:hypothetical protein